MTHASVDILPTSRHPRAYGARFSLILVLNLLAMSPLLTSQDSVDAIRGHFDVTPLFSYRTGMSFGIQPQPQQTNPHVVLDDSLGYGIAFGVHIREGDAIEFRWNRQNSNTHIRDAGTSFPRTLVTLDQFHCDLSHEYVLRGRAQKVRPFVMGSVGATTISSSGIAGSTQLSLGIGGGLKFLIGKHLGFRFQTQWLPIFVDPQQRALCGSGCSAHVGGTLGSQFEVAAGPMFRF